MSGPHTRNLVGTIRSYHFVMTFAYHGFGNSGCSRNAIANGMVPDKALVLKLTWLLAFAGPGFNVLTPGALEREQFAAGALSLNAKQQHCRPAFGAVGPLDRIGMRCCWLILGHRGLIIFIFVWSTRLGRVPNGDQRWATLSLIFKPLATILIRFQSAAQGDK